MKIKLPSCVKIGNMNYKVCYKKHLKSDDGWRGTCNHRTCEIQIDPDCGGTQDTTYLHEVVHMIDANYEMGMDEANISRMANGLAEYLFDNLGIQFDWRNIKLS